MIWYPLLAPQMAESWERLITGGYRSSDIRFDKRASQTFVVFTFIVLFSVIIILLKIGSSRLVWRWKAVPIRVVCIWSVLKWTVTITLSVGGVLMWGHECKHAWWFLKIVFVSCHCLFRGGIRVLCRIEICHMERNVKILISFSDEMRGV